MSRIGDRLEPSTTSTMREVRGALRAEQITVEVDSDVAPLSNELLPRFEPLFEGTHEDISPRPPGHDVIAPSERTRILSRVSTQLAAVARAHPDERALETATQIVRAHVGLATELALRSPIRD